MSSSSIDNPPVWNVGSNSGILPSGTTVTGAVANKTDPTLGNKSSSVTSSIHSFSSGISSTHHSSTSSARSNLPSTNRNVINPTIGSFQPAEKVGGVHASLLSKQAPNIIKPSIPYTNAIIPGSPPGSAEKQGQSFSTPIGTEKQGQKINPLRSPRMTRLPGGITPIQTGSKSPSSAPAVSHSSSNLTGLERPVQPKPLPMSTINQSIAVRKDIANTPSLSTTIGSTELSSSITTNNSTQRPSRSGTILPVIPNDIFGNNIPSVSTPVLVPGPSNNSGGHVKLTQPIKFSEMVVPGSSLIEEIVNLSTNHSSSVLSPPNSPRSSNIPTPFDDMIGVCMMDPLSSGPGTPSSSSSQNIQIDQNNSLYGISFGSSGSTKNGYDNHYNGGIGFGDKSGSFTSTFNNDANSFGITFQSPTTPSVFSPSIMSNNNSNNNNVGFGVSFGSAEPKKRRFIKPIDTPAQTVPVPPQPAVSNNPGVIQFPRIIGSIPMVDYNSFSPDVQAVYRADFKMKSKALHTSFPEIELVSSEGVDDLYTLHAIYERNTHLILTMGNIDSSRNWLVLFWMFVEFMGWKVGLPAVGYTANQIAKADSYRTLMLQLGERSYNTFGRGWPVELQIALLAGKQMLFFMVYKLLSRFMVENNAQHVVDKLEGFLTKPAGVARSSDPNSPVPSPPAPASAGTFGGLFNTFFGGGGGTGFTGALSTIGGLFGGGATQEGTATTAGSTSTATAASAAPAPPRASRFRPQVAREEPVKPQN